MGLLGYLPSGAGEFLATLLLPPHLIFLSLSRGTGRTPNGRTDVTHSDIDGDTIKLL